MTRSRMHRAFLPVNDPLFELPETYKILDKLGAELPSLLAAGKARKVLSKMPQVDVFGLETTDQKERALGLLSMFGHACVHESWRSKSSLSVPNRVAAPWVALAKSMNRLPALTYYSHGLCNWRRFDSDAPIELGNIAILRNFFGGLDENWFVAIHVDIEAKAVPLVNAVVSAQEAVEVDDPDCVLEGLLTICDSQESILKSLVRLSENCDPDIFFNRVQPFMQGLKDTFFEGVEDFRGQPQSFAGGSGAQSALMPLLDATLGIIHAKDELLAYLSDLRRYMPAEHRLFLSEVEKGPSIRDYVLSKQDRALADAYNCCINGVASFRANHLQMSVDYIQRPARKSSDTRGRRGTGGSPYVGYLKKHREETYAALI
ncbi:MAG: hypothetical protein AB2806_04220 [Candidatus Thiodiazotropha sp.]